MIVSNTEVTSFSTCRRAHYYRFALQIEPRDHVISKALYRGIVGHRIWEAYYTALKQGYSVDQAKDAAFSQIQTELLTVAANNPESYDMIEIILQLQRLLDAYVEVYRVDNFETLEVETAYHTSLTNDIEYGLKLDLLIRMTKGEFKGDLVVMDHKFLYNFKTSRELELDGQLPKYIKTVADNGYVVTKGIFNQIRWRSLKNNDPTKLFQRDMLRVKPTETATIWREQGQVAEEIRRLRALPVEEYSKVATRNMSPYICRSCYFATICKLELNGRDIKNAIAMDYQPNTYGYDSLLEDE